MKTEHIEAQIERVTKRINLSKQDIETKQKRVEHYKRQIQNLQMSIEGEMNGMFLIKQTIGNNEKMLKELKTQL